MHSNEPKTAAAVKRWVEKHTRSSDRFQYLADKYEAHRKEHGCFDVYPFSNGLLLAALAAAAKPKRLLEVGCGLGYSGLWLAYGAGPRGYLETIEASKEHAKIARDHHKAEGLEKRIQVFVGEATRVLPALKGGYDLFSSTSVRPNRWLSWIIPNGCSGKAGYLFQQTCSWASSLPTFRDLRRRPNIVCVFSMPPDGSLDI